MEGRNHILCSSAITICAAINHISFDRIRNGEVSTFYGQSVEHMTKLLDIEEKIWLNLGFHPELNIKLLPVVALLMFVMIVGTLMTDCDKANSLAGRFLYIPVQHRTWLHAIWIPGIVFTIGWVLMSKLNISIATILIWYGLGWFLHEFMDSFSKMGNSYLYPIVKYNSYGNAKVKQGLHVFKLYYAGRPSEGVFVAFTLLNCIASSIFIYLSPNYTIDLARILKVLPKLFTFAL